MQTPLHASSSPASFVSKKVFMIGTVSSSELWRLRCSLCHGYGSIRSSLGSPTLPCQRLEGLVCAPWSGVAWCRAGQSLPWGVEEQQCSVPYSASSVPAATHCRADGSRCTRSLLSMYCTNANSSHLKHLRSMFSWSNYLNWIIYEIHLKSGLMVK